MFLAFSFVRFQLSLFAFHTNLIELCSFDLLNKNKMKKIVLILTMFTTLISCEKEEFNPCIVSYIEDGIYVQQTCKFGFDTLKIKGDSFLLTRNIRENNTFNDDFEGVIEYRCDSITFIPSSYYRLRERNEWVRVKTPLTFKYSDTLTLETKKPLTYQTKEFDYVSGCNELYFFKFQ
jgi:hypothetical protein